MAEEVFTTTVKEARVLQSTGKWVKNVFYDPANSVDLRAQQEFYFRAKYSVLYRPNMLNGPYSDDDPALIVEL
jgi:hypothetical protein